MKLNIIERISILILLPLNILMFIFSEFERVFTGKIY